MHTYATRPRTAVVRLLWKVARLASCWHGRLPRHGLVRRICFFYGLTYVVHLLPFTLKGVVGAAREGFGKR